MVSEQEVENVARLGDISIDKERLGEFTAQFNKILSYFDLLDQVAGEGDAGEHDLYNVLRDDEVEASLSHEEAISNAGETEEGYIKAPRVM